MSQPLLQIDAFTDRAFGGNPAAVCLLEEPRSERWMQDVAAEMNLSETAFLRRQESAWGLRWFTPTCEVELCGHATLASAHALWEGGHLDPAETARFDTLSGRLEARLGGGGWIELDFPSTPVGAAEPPVGLERALGSSPRYVGRSRWDLVVELESEAAVRQLRPDLGQVREIDARGVIVTARSREEGIDFVSRFFGPRVGVDEDPVTGSAHCALAPYWGERLGKEEMVGVQASARGGIVRVRRAGDRVRLGGRAVTVLRGELLA